MKLPAKPIPGWFMLAFDRARSVTMNHSTKAFRRIFTITPSGVCVVVPRFDAIFRKPRP